MKKLHIITLVLLLVGTACTRDDALFEGPALNDLYGDFHVITGLEASNTNVDFAAGETTFFTAQFSMLVDWQLKITGLTSGAQKIIAGQASELTVDNALWDGSTTEFPMFKAEDCEVELFIPSDTVYLYDTITVASPKVNEGFLITDFENGIDSNWDIFVQSGADMSFVIKSDDASPQGNSYYDMGGKVDWDWLIGMIEFPATAYGEPTFSLSSNPDNLYFNVLIYLPEGITNAMVLFQFREDDNEDGAFSDATEDMYSLELSEMETGWQLVSIKYSELVCLVNGEPGEPNGNGVHNPELLHKLSVLMLADPSSGYSQTLMDYLIFTENAPLNP